MTPRIGNDGQSGEDALRVLLSTRGPFKTTNPYVVQLADSIRTCGASVRYFSWQTALFGSYDILHIHWPEIMIRRDGALARAAAQVRFILLMLRLRLTGTPIVRTAHNVRAHETGSRTETALLRWCDRQTRTWIVLNELSPYVQEPNGYSFLTATTPTGLRDTRNLNPLPAGSFRSD